MTMTSLPKRRRREKMGVREPSQIRCAAHLKWVRGHECLVRHWAGHWCYGKIEAAHVRTGTGAGVGIKPGDEWTIPLCAGAHWHQHQIGEAAFERQFGIDMKAIAEGLAARSPALRKRARALELEA